jgi:hypothetical protein
MRLVDISGAVCASTGPQRIWQGSCWLFRITKTSTTKVTFYIRQTLRGLSVRAKKSSSQQRPLGFFFVLVWRLLDPMTAYCTVWSLMQCAAFNTMGSFSPFAALCTKGWFHECMVLPLPEQPLLRDFLKGAAAACQSVKDYPFI